MDDIGHQISYFKNESNKSPSFSSQSKVEPKTEIQFYILSSISIERDSLS